MARTARWAWPVYLIVGALFVAGAVLSLMGPREDSVAVLDRTGSSDDEHAIDLSSLRGKNWIAGFAVGMHPEARAQAQAAFVALRSQVPATIPLAQFLAVESDTASESVRSFTVAGARELADVALHRFGVPRAEWTRLTEAPAGLLLIVVDRAGKATQRYGLSGTESLDEQVAGAFAKQVRLLAALQWRPRLHAMLNGTSAVLLVLGLLFIRRKQVPLHVACMILAVCVTLTFLASYLNYHYHAGSLPFAGTGWSRPLYFGVLLSHTVLAAFLVPLVSTVLFWAVRRRFDKHRRVARWTLPIWIYVSVTGVLIYFMLYVWFT
jgi:putative membrane protein